MGFLGGFHPVLVVIMFVAACTNICHGARILCVCHQFGSHQLMVHSAVEGLIARGHEVYTVYSDRMRVPKGLQEKGFKILRYHTPEESSILTTDENAKKIFDSILSDDPNEFNAMFLYSSEIARNECIDIDNDLALTKTITDLNFDLAIIDTFILGLCMPFVSLKFNLPFVIVANSFDIEMTRTPILPSFYPNEFSELTDEMTFTERLMNTFTVLYVNSPSVNRLPGRLNTMLLNKYSKDDDMTTWNDLSRKAELFLISRGYVVEYPAPLTPNVINLECLTCKPGKELSADIEALIAGYDGVIVVSFGSLVDDFPDDLARKFMEAFADMKELVFWRFNGKYPGHIPGNVKLMKWLPQNDLLAHPKTKLFITHSGNNGQYESVYHGVPMLAFPCFAEQPHNAVRTVKHGFGIRIEIKSFTTQELLGKMRETIENPSYKEKTEKAGRILKSHPMDAQETATYWIEHVLEFGGDHLRSHALKMPWYSFYMIDILLFLEALIIGVTCAGICACSWVSKRVCGAKGKQKRE